MARTRSSVGDYPLSVLVELGRRRRGGVDDYGDPIDGYDWSELMVFAVVEGGDEPATARQPERVRYDLTVYAPSAAGITAEDRVRWRGAEYELDGPPGDWDTNPWWPPGIVVCRCNLVKG